MSVMNFATSLMLDFRCLILPRFIYAVGSDFSGDKIINAEIQQRIELLAQDTQQLARFRQSIQTQPARAA